jgi:hypothetical protein
VGPALGTAVSVLLTNTVVDERHQSAAGVPGQSGIHTAMTHSACAPVGGLGPERS